MGAWGLSFCPCNTSLSLSPGKQDQYERAEQERKVQRKKEAEDKQKLQDQLRSYEEHMLQLRKKLEHCCVRQLEEHQKMIRHKSKVPSGRVQVPRCG